MEKDDEISGIGSSYHTMFRQYDPRLGRWMSVDPVTHSWMTPYNGMDNNPIGLVDPFGLSTGPGGGPGDDEEEECEDDNGYELDPVKVEGCFDPEPPQEEDKPETERECNDRERLGNDLRRLSDMQVEARKEYKRVLEAKIAENESILAYRRVVRAGNDQLAQADMEVRKTLAVGGMNEAVRACEDLAAESPLESNGYWDNFLSKDSPNTDASNKIAGGAGVIYGATEYTGGVSWTAAAKTTGRLLIGVNFLLDYYRYDQGEISKGKLFLNTSVGVWGAATGPSGWACATSYYVLDTFYPGGFEAAMVHQKNLINDNQRILGKAFNPYKELPCP